MKHCMKIFLVMIILSLCGCSTNEQVQSEKEVIKDDTIVSYDADDLDEDYTDENPQSITLNGDKISYSGDGAVVKGTTFTIQKEGTYVFTGTLKDGSIVVNAAKNDLVRIVLKDASITSSNTAAIYVKQAGKVLLTLDKNTKNSVSDGKTYVLEDSAVNEPNAAIFAKDNLTINGSGSLTINAQYNNGIQSKDDLKIVNGTITIKAVDNGIVGKDLLAIRDGTLMIDAQGDGLRTTNTKDEAKGILSLEGGTLHIIAGQDGIQSENKLYIYGGVIDITAGGGNTKGTKIRQEQGFNPFEQTTANENTISMKGIKAANAIYVKGGTMTIDSADDALHSNGDITISKGSLTLSSGDDGIHSDSLLYIKNGTIDILTSYEGLEAETIKIHNGTIHIKSSDDGVNASGSTPLLQIDGGYLFVYADGDGLDSNGDITMSDGTVIIEGTQGGGDGALDFDGDFKISGGILIASGSGDMLQYPTSVQNGCQMIIGFENNMSDLLHIVDKSGTSILTYQPSRAYQVVTLYTSKLKAGNTVEIYTGGSASAKKDGIYDDSTYTGGTLYKEVDLNETTTIIGTLRGGMNTIPNRGGPEFH